MPEFVMPANVPDVPELPKAFDGPPHQIHSGQIEELEGGVFKDNPALKRASETLKFGFEGAASINELRGNPDGEDRAATHDRKVREKADGFQSAWCEKLDGTRADLKRELANVDTRLETNAGLKANPAHFNAIIGTLQVTPVGERPKVIAEMIEAGDYETLATIIEAPLFLTGLAADFRASIKTRVLAKVDPQGLKLRNTLATALEKVEAASLAALPMFAKLRDGTAPGAWKERAQLAAARNMATNLGRR